MEDGGNKKTVVVLFFFMVGIFLFIYKGFIKNTENYLIEYNNYVDSLRNNKTNIQKWLKGNNKAKGENSTHSKHKIPNEIMNMDNTLLDTKSLLSVLNGKNEKIYKIMEEMKNKNKTYRSEDIAEIWKSIEREENQFRLEKEQIDKNLDDIMTNLDALRKYEIITKKNNTAN